MICLRNKEDELMGTPLLLSFNFFVLDKTKGVIMRVSLSLGSTQSLTKFEAFEHNFEYLHTLTKLYRYSASFFYRDYRARQNFVSAMLIILDFDDGLTLAKAKEVFALYACLIVTTKTHQKTMKNGKSIKARDKFRVIMIANEVLDDVTLFETVMRNIVAKYKSDPAATDSARFYEPNPEQEVWYSDSQSLFDISPYKAVEKLPIQPKIGANVLLSTSEKNKGIAVLDADPYITSNAGDTLQASKWLEYLDIGQHIRVHCPNPTHTDNHPSARIKKFTDNTLYVDCYVCGALGRYPIFTTKLTKEYNYE